MIVDFHTHLFPPWIIERREQYVEQDSSFAQLYRHPKARMASVEGLIASMDAAGIDQAVALNFGWASPRLCQETNDYLIETVHRYPERLVGFCSVQPRQPQEAVREIHRCAQAGLRGVGELMPDGQGFDLADEETMRPMVKAACEEGMILLPHASEPVGHIYPGKGTVHPQVLYRFLTAFPEVEVVLPHFGGGLPFYALMPEVAAALRRVSFDAAAFPLLYRPQIFVALLPIVGAAKILFGTDYPLLRQEALLETVRSLPLDEAARQAILGANALRLLRKDHPGA